MTARVGLTGTMGRLAINPSVPHVVDAHFSRLLSIVRLVRLLEYISRRGRHFLHEHFDKRCASRSSRAGRRARLHLGGSTLAGHRNRREYRNLQHRRWSVTSSTSVQGRRAASHTLEPISWFGHYRGLVFQAQYFDIRNGHHGFEQVAIAIGGNYNLTGWGEPERLGQSVSRRVCCPCWDSGQHSDDCLLPTRTSRTEPPPPAQLRNMDAALWLRSRTRQEDHAERRAL